MSYEAIQANRILAFVRSHDWGEGAYLEDGRVCGVLDRYTVRNADGTVTLHEDETSLPLNLREIRDWAGY